MSVLFLHPDLGIGGAERAIVDAAMAAKHAGYDVEIVTNFHDINHAFEETVDGSLRVTPVCQWLPRSVMGHFLALCAYMKMILASVWIVFARRRLVDLVFVDQVSAPLLVLKLAGMKVSSFRNIDSKPRQYSSVTSPIYYCRLMIPGFEKFTAILKGNWSKLVKDSPLSSSDVYIVHAGGYDVRVRENVEYFDELKQLLEDLKTTDFKLLKISEQAVLLRSVPSGTKSLLIAASSALIYTPALEHFGIVPIEAMYLGRPVIAMDAGGPRETLVHCKTGFLCPIPSSGTFDNVETASQIAEYMCKFINDPELTTTMGKHCHAHVLQKFSTRAFQKKLCRIFKHTLSDYSVKKQQ